MESQAQTPKLLDQVRNVLRLHHYSIHTESSYIDWIWSGPNKILERKTSHTEKIFSLPGPGSARADRAFFEEATTRVCLNIVRFHGVLT